MKNLIALLIMLLAGNLLAQYEYDASEKYPYGKPNPKAPEQIKDYSDLIGLSECNSVTRNQDGTWQDTIDMQWKFKYIMNGMGVQDLTLKEDGKHSGSIRQYNADSARWYVHYYSSAYALPPLSYWEGNMNDGKMILYRDQTAPNGMEGSYRITFYDISTDSFKWIGEWVSKDESIIYPTWKIDCKKIQ